MNKLNECNETLSGFCRACLKTDRKLHLASEVLSTSYSVFVSQVDPDNPPSFCSYCGYLLMKSVKFLQQCCEADQSLKSLHDQKDVLQECYKLEVTSLEQINIYPQGLDSGCILKEEFKSDNSSDEDSINNLTEAAPSARRQPASVNADWTTPLHHDEFLEPTSSSLISEKLGSSKSSSIWNMAHGLSDKRTSTIAKSYKRDFVDTRDKINKKLFECDHCKYSTSRRGSIQRHMRIHSEEPGSSKYNSIWNVAHCLTGKRTSTIAKSYKRDFVDTRDKINKKLFECDHCKYSTSRRGSIQRHMRIHSEEPGSSKYNSIWNVAHCLTGKRTSTIAKSYKRDFVDTRDKINKKLFECDHCKYSTSRRGSIQRHMRIHSKEPGSSKYNSIWNVAHGLSGKRTSTIPTSYKRDFVDTRDKSHKKLYKCDHCKYSTSRRSNIQRHIRVHTGEKPYKCKHCDYSASRNERLQTHIRIHTGEKPYKCKYCDYSASQNRTLQKHIRIHTGEKPYKCKLCDYSASQNSYLQTHIRIHTGEKPYKCKLCDYSASANIYLKKHLRVHTGEKPYKCKQCDYCASENSNLKMHLRVHTGEKPYKCKHCEYSASRNSTLQRHFRIHRREAIQM